MGIQASMSRSLKKSANFVFKLHTAALLSNGPNVTLYPVMDGIYVASSSQIEMLNFLRNLFRILALEFVNEQEMLHRFVVRGALAFGPVIHGSDVPEQASRKMEEHKGYRDCLLLGLPMVQSNSSENSAPPFGIKVHESARAFAPSDQESEPLQYVWWKWWNNKSNSDIASKLDVELDRYFTWCSERAGQIEYDSSRIEVHRAMAKQYIVEN